MHCSRIAGVQVHCSRIAGVQVPNSFLLSRLLGSLRVTRAEHLGHVARGCCFSRRSADVILPGKRCNAGWNQL